MVMKIKHSQILCFHGWRQQSADGHIARADFILLFGKSVQQIWNPGIIIFSQNSSNWHLLLLFK